jgi:soluble lytic murein transglycosylase-like protein
MLFDLVRPITIYQIGDGVPWNEWEASLMGVASQFRSYDVVSAAQRALDSHAALYTRVEDRPYTKSELVKHLYRVCEQFNIDRVIAYNQITAESSFNPNATGGYCVLGSLNKKCGAGIAQFIPGTAVAYGLRVDREVDERFDPIKSLNSYGAYMRDLLNKFGGDYLKALAAYNAGPGAVDKSIERNGDGWLGGMPSETQVYVVRILGDRAISDRTVLESVQQSVQKGATTKIGLWDLLTSDLGPDLIKRWALVVIGVAILFGVIVSYGLKYYKKYA